jgi:hypothetical protein
MSRILRTLLIASLLAYSLACKVSGGNVQENDLSISQKPSPLYPVTINDKHGFIDHSGRLVINLPTEVYNVRKFSEGLAVIAKEVPNTHGRWGFIDESGVVVIEPRFNGAKPFSEGLAAVVISDDENTIGRVGYIDKTGQLVIQPQFSQVM